jgi:Na+-driven multidrug efflux pump
MKEFGMIRDAYRFTIKRSFIMLVVLCVIFALLAYPIADIFLRTDDMVHMRDIMVVFTIEMAAFMPLFSMVFVGSSLMQALEKAGQAMMNTLVRNIMITVTYAIVAYCTTSGLIGIGVALIIVECLGGAAMLLHGKIVLDKVEREYNASSRPTQSNML